MEINLGWVSTKDISHWVWFTNENNFIRSYKPKRWVSLVCDQPMKLNSLVLINTNEFSCSGELHSKSFLGRKPPLQPLSWEDSSFANNSQGGISAKFSWGGFFGLTIKCFIYFFFYSFYTIFILF